MGGPVQSSHIPPWQPHNKYNSVCSASGSQAPLSCYSMDFWIFRWSYQLQPREAKHRRRGLEGLHREHGMSCGVQAAVAQVER